MQYCLEAEPQVAVTRHLLKQVPHAILVPEEVRVDLMLVDTSREFDLTSSEQDQAPIARDRIPDGSVFVLNRETVSLWDGNGDQRLPGSTVQIPDPLQQRYRPMLFTEICTYKKHVLKDYDSGLNYPRPLRVDSSILPGATIDFVYELGEHPRLIASIRKCAESE